MARWSLPARLPARSRPLLRSQTAPTQRLHTPVKGAHMGSSLVTLKVTWSIQLKGIADLLRGFENLCRQGGRPEALTALFGRWITQARSDSVHSSTLSLKKIEKSLCPGTMVRLDESEGIVRRVRYVTLCSARPNGTTVVISRGQRSLILQRDDIQTRSSKTFFRRSYIPL